MNQMRLLSTLLLCLVPAVSGCSGKYHTFADHPGFEGYYRDRCLTTPEALSERDRRLLARHRPRLVLPPGGAFPVDFYRDYLPYSVLRSWPEKKVLATEVNRGLLLKHRVNRGAYLDFDIQRYRAEGMDLRWREGMSLAGPERQPVVYGRVYRESVPFTDSRDIAEVHDLTFLKYNIVFATSGLPWDLSLGSRILLGLGFFDLEDWHPLDNFVAVHVVLDEEEEPVALVLAQHNHHRTYLLGRDILLPADGRPALDIALRSNEIYPASDSSEPVRHRVIRWNLYLDYLLSGENGPLLTAADVTMGRYAGGVEFSYDLQTLSPCDPLYTSEMLLGQPRPFLGIYLGRDGPPGSDYYSVPELLPPGNLLKFSYLHDGDPGDIAVVRQAVDRRRRRIDFRMVMDHGGRRFLEDWRQVKGE